jgi:hypothetical protein
MKLLNNKQLGWMAPYGAITNLEELNYEKESYQKWSCSVEKEHDIEVHIQHFCRIIFLLTTNDFIKGSILWFNTI